MCHSELTREFSNLAVRLVQKILARATEVGSRTIVYGASAGAESHGQYLPDCQVGSPRGVCKEKDADKTQSRFWEELKAQLESIQPGVTTLS